MIPWRHLKILPVLIFVAALSFSLRAAEFFAGFSAAPGQVFAQDTAAPPPAAGLNAPSAQDGNTATAQAAAGDSAGDAAATDQGAQSAPPAVPRPEERIDWRDSADEDIEQSEVKMELFQDLAARRTEIQERERELVLREALLKAATQELEQKYKELESLREEIQELLKQQTEEEKSRIASLVKIYEGMKAKDAARIFDSLDMDVLMQVMTQMSERKSAPIIAAMSADKARSVTIMLAEQKKIPSLAEPFIPQN